MNFASGGASEAKAWRDIWGSGQGIGAVKAVQPVAELVARLEREYATPRAKRLNSACCGTDPRADRPSVKRSTDDAPSGRDSSPVTVKPIVEAGE